MDEAPLPAQDIHDAIPMDIEQAPLLLEADTQNMNTGSLSTSLAVSKPVDSTGTNLDFTESHLQEGSITQSKVVVDEQQGDAPATGMQVNNAPATGTPVSDGLAMFVLVDSASATDIPVGDDLETIMPVDSAPATDLPAEHEPATDLLVDGPATDLPVEHGLATSVPVDSASATTDTLVGNDLATIMPVDSAPATLLVDGPATDSGLATNDGPLTSLLVDGPTTDMPVDGPATDDGPLTDMQFHDVLTIVHDHGSDDCMAQNASAGRSPVSESEALRREHGCDGNSVANLSPRSPARQVDMSTAAAASLGISEYGSSSNGLSPQGIHNPVREFILATILMPAVNSNVQFRTMLLFVACSLMSLVN